MFKKIGLLIITIIILIIIVFNGYKIMIYNEFRNYLYGKYPNKSFDLHWVKYDFIYGNTFYTTVYCQDDKTEFFIRKNDNVISGEYLENKKRNERNNKIFSYLKAGSVSDYISSVSSGLGRISYIIRIL